MWVKWPTRGKVRGSGVEGQIYSAYNIISSTLLEEPLVMCSYHEDISSLHYYKEC